MVSSYVSLYRKQRVSQTIDLDEEPQWNLSEELHDAIFDGMDDSLSVDEKIMYVYGKLAQISLYEEGSNYMRHLSIHAFDGKIDTKFLESMKPHDKMVCFDFSRIFLKCIDEIAQTENGVKSFIVVLKEGPNKHFCTSVVTPNSILVFDSMNIPPNIKDPTSDMLKSKLGISLGGIMPIVKQAGFEASKEKVEEILYGRKPHNFEKLMNSIREHKKRINSENYSEIDESQKLKISLSSFLKFAQKHNITGSELVQLYRCYRSEGVFGNVECAYLGKLTNFKKMLFTFRTSIMIRSKNDYKQKKNNAPIFLLDTNGLSLKEYEHNILQEAIFDRKFFLQNPNKSLEGISWEE